MDRIVVTWPTGAEQTVDGRIAMNSLVEILEEP